MKLEHVKTFVMVADELHFGRAAARLHLAQPAVSQHIKLLEAHLGVQLFDRSTRSVRLSEHGLAFYEPARELLAGVERAERAARFGHAQVTGSVSLGFSGLSSGREVPAVVRAMGEEYPGIEVVLRGMGFETGMVREVTAGNLDAGITRLPLREPDLDWHVYEYQRLIAALPESHVLARRGSVGIAELCREPLVTFPAGNGSTVREATLHLAAEASRSFKVIQEAPDTSSILGLVASGFGVSVTVAPVESVSVPGVAFRPLSGRVPLMAAAFFWRRNTTNRAVHAFVELVTRRFPVPDHTPDLVFGTRTRPRVRGAASAGEN